MQKLLADIKGRQIQVHCGAAYVKVTRKALIEAIKLHKPARVISNPQGVICFVQLAALEDN